MKRFLTSLVLLLALGVGASSQSWAPLASAIPTDTFNSADSFNISLSGGNLTAAPTASGDPQVRTNSARSTGLVYFESTYTFQNVAGAQNIGVGLCSGSHNFTTNFVGQDTLSVGFWAGATSPPAQFYFNNVTTSLAAGMGGSTGAVFGYAINFSLNKFWAIRILPTATGWNNDVIANQNPALGIGGFDISALTGAPWYVCTDLEPTNPIITLNFGASTYSCVAAGVCPLGYSNWYSPRASYVSPIIVADGDSYTHGQSGNTGYPGGMVATLNTQVAVQNIGVAQTSAQQLANFATKAAPLFVSALPRKKFYVTVPATDDRPPVTIAQVEANDQAIVNAALAAGANEIIVGTVPVFFFNVNNFTINTQADVNNYNNFLLTGLIGVTTTFDVSTTGLGNAGNLTNPTYFVVGDPVPHPSTNAYNNIWGPIAATAVNSQLP